MFGHTQHVAEFVVERQVVNIEQQGPRSIARFGDMYLAAGQLVDQPGIDGAQCGVGRIRDTSFGKEPGELGATEIGV